MLHVKEDVKKKESSVNKRNNVFYGFWLPGYDKVIQNL